MKRFINLLLALIITCGYLSASKGFTLVIDAGHGGRDGGAVRGKSKEKDINLGVVLKLGRFIEDNMKDVKVVYTRKTDVFVDLNKRANIANKAKANLFISIHTNSTEAKVTSASGADTYMLGLGRSDENMRVAQRENSVILLEDNYKQKYENFDPKSPESYIIFEFMTNKYMDQSLEFASSVQRNFKSVAKRTDRGVRQAGFLVLRETASPSVLIELGFINNLSEAKFLTSAAGQQSMASAIYAGFKEYKNNFDKRQGAASIEKPRNNKPTEKPAEKPVEKPMEKEKPEEQVEEQTEGKAPEADTVSPVVIEPAKTEPIETPKPETQATEVQAEKPIKKPIASNQTEYRVQILISPEKLAATSPSFKGLSPVDFYKDGSIYKYTYGSTDNRNEAVQIQHDVRSKFKDAFIIEMKNGKRIK